LLGAASYQGFQIGLVGAVLQLQAAILQSPAYGGKQLLTFERFSK
jgi:hypothetical protein